LLLVVFATLLILGVISVTADSANAALVVKQNGGCNWWYGQLKGNGSVKYVETKNGKWTLSCQGSAGWEEPIHRAVQVKSTSAKSIGTCFTEFGTTSDWHMTFTPSGKSSFVCHGDLTP
jgi:hypothetical protein